MLTQLFLLLPLLAVAYSAPTSNTAYDVTSGTKVDLQNTPAVGLSFEFFAFPGYQNLSNNAQCLDNMDAAAGGLTPIRIGGTTQDRALFAPDQAEAVKYYVPDSTAAPANLTYGPSFFSLANARSNPTTIGLNRRLNQLNNTIEAAIQAKQTMSNLYAIELGNEPDLYTKSDPIAQGKTWNPTADQQSQLYWQKAVSEAIQCDGRIQAGVFLQPPTYAIAKLAPLETSTGEIEYIKDFCDHAYPQSACGGSTTNLPSLMNHTTIVKFVSQFQPEVAAAHKAGKAAVFGETNSATCGGGGISPTFGASLWLLDYVFQAVLLGYERLHFHQGTIGNSPYSFWGQGKVFAPYYGAMFAAQALNSVTSMAQLDSGSGSVAVYALYVNGESQPSRYVVYNSAYYVNGTRPSTSIDLTNINGSSLASTLLTATSAYSRQENGDVITLGGVSYDNTTCQAVGQGSTGSIAVTGGRATVTVAASEAVYLNVQ